MRPRPRSLILAALAASAAGCGGLLDPDAPGWRQIEAETGPGPRWGHALVYDAARDRLLSFGGEGPGGKLADTWALSLESEQWEELATSEGPAPRARTAAILDAPRDRLLVVGGETGEPFPSGETWALDLTTLAWSELPPIPIGRFGAAAVSDDRHAWLHGGQTGAFDELEDLWELDLETEAWSPRTNTGPHPGPRGGGALAKRGNHLVLTMGSSGGEIVDETWEYGLSTLHWFQLAPLEEPVVGSHYGVAMDAACETLLLAGGDDGDDYDVGITSALVLKGTPRFELFPSSDFLPPRRHAAAAVDPVRRRLIVMGGVQGYGAMRDDTWIHPLGGCL